MGHRGWGCGNLDWIGMEYHMMISNSTATTSHLGNHDVMKTRFSVMRTRNSRHEERVKGFNISLFARDLVWLLEYR